MSLNLFGWLTGKSDKDASEASAQPKAAPAGPDPVTPAVAKPPLAPAVPRAKGHAEAARRIAAFTKWTNTAKSNQWLDLSGLGLSTLPPEVSLLTEIGHLNLNNNELTDEAIDSLAHLSKVKQLRLRRNKLAGRCLEKLAALPHLKSLDIGLNEIGKHPAGLARLGNLTMLSIDSNQLDGEAMRLLALLTHLTELHAQNNKVSDEGARALAALTKLKTLYLSNNPIGREGVNALSSLTSLQHLNLDRTQLGPQGAAALACLTALKRLDLSRSGVTDLHFLDALQKLKTLSLNGLELKTEDAERLRRPGLKVYLYKSKLGDFPQEALSRHGTDDCMPRLRKHIEAREKDDKPTVEVRDVKVMLLGNGRVGKTQLRRSLNGEAFDSTIDSTHGVEVVPVEIASDAPRPSSPTPLQVWDFGGQDIYLGTHALFLKTRAVFPILWTPESEANETHYVDGIPYRNYPLNEWLRYVLQLAGEESPVLLIQSQCESPADQVAPAIDDGIVDRFAIKPRLLYYSARTGEPKSDLLSALRGAITDLGEPKRISARWNRVKTAVEQRARSGAKRMVRAEFNDICTEMKVTDPEAQSVLLKMLHDLGTLFHDQEVLGDLIVLDQNWALRAIYAVFERKPGTYEKLMSLNGRFTATDLGHLVWNKEHHTPDDQAGFVAMMVACKAAFQLRAPSETHGEALYIAPDLLPERSVVQGQLDHYESDFPDAAQEFHFAFALPSMLRELMGRWASQAGQKGIYWKEGLWFKKSKSYVIVEALRPNDRSWRATIRIRGWRGNAAAVVERLSTEVREIAERFGAEPERGTEPLLEATPLSLDELETSEAGAALPEEPEPDENSSDKRCFISYAWGGERASDPEDDDESARTRSLAFTRVEARLRALGLEPYFDKQRLRHGESISAFMETAANQERFVVILSKKYLTSPYCMDELLRIWRNCRSNADEFRARIRAIVLDDADIDSMEARDKISQYWSAKRDSAAGIMEGCVKSKRPPEEEAMDTLRVAHDLTAHAATILAKIKDAFPIRGVEDIDKLSF